MKISVLVIIHNRAELFKETIRSILAQSYPIHEFIILDDGSTEDVRGVVESFKIPFVKYFYVKRVGRISTLRNMVLAKATGDVVTFIDSDDLLHKDKLKLQIEAMEKYGVPISFSDSQYFNSNGLIGQPLCAHLKEGPIDMFVEMIDNNQPLVENLFFKREIPGETIAWDEHLIAGDHDLLLRLTSRHPSVFVGQVLNLVRRHAGNHSGDLSVTQLTSYLEYNRSLDKLLAVGAITVRQYRRVRAYNYVMASRYYVRRNHSPIARKYLMKAISLYPKPEYIGALFRQFFS